MIQSTQILFKYALIGIIKHLLAIGARFYYFLSDLGTIKKVGISEYAIYMYFGLKLSKIITLQKAAIFIIGRN